MPSVITEGIFVGIKAGQLKQACRFGKLRDT